MTALAALKALALGIGFGLALLYAYLFIVQGQMIFPGAYMSLNAAPNIQSTIENASFKELETPDGERLQGWVLDRGARAPLIIYFGGNAEEVSGNLADFNRMFPHWSVALFNYRGFAGSTGTPSEVSISDDAILIYDSIKNRLSPSRVVLMGRSLGAGVAVILASTQNVDGLILVSPYRSLVHLGQRHYPIVPVGLLLRHRFNAIALAPEVNVPAIVIAGASDSIIPPDESAMLYEALPRGQGFVTIPDADHNDIQMFSAYWDVVTEFLSAQNN